jgi:hypothetical protein
MKKTVKLLLKSYNSKGFEMGQVPMSESVLPYIVFNDPIMEGDNYFNKNGELMVCIGNESNNDLEGSIKIVALPNEIPTDDESLIKMRMIMNNGGEFDMEMEDEFSNPKAFENVGWGEGLPRPILINGKISF